MYSKQDAKFLNNSFLSQYFPHFLLKLTTLDSISEDELDVGEWTAAILGRSQLGLKTGFIPFSQLEEEDEEL